MPRTDAVLADPRIQAAAARLGRPAVKAAVQAAQQRVRAGDLSAGTSAVAEAALAALPAASTELRAVLNATGVVLHTNLGRAPLSAAATQALLLASGYVDVEYDLATGTRARRGRSAVSALLAALPETADVDALVVNNGAAAVLLAATALAGGREIVISRGELVEIGDGFRLPDLVSCTGARLREVGTTNRTVLADYVAALGSDTGFVLKVHPSNFRISGFTTAVSTTELAGLGVPVVVDIGSGLLTPEPLLPDEPDAASALAAGAALVTASGDKLLGGPQAGLVIGQQSYVERLRRHPLARAVRPDKLTLAALEATVRGPAPPVQQSLQASEAELRIRANGMVELLARAGVTASVASSEGVVGGGGAPGRLLTGWAVALPASWARPLRLGTPPVVGRVERDRLLLDLRCLAPDQDGTVCAAVLAVARAVA